MARDTTNPLPPSPLPMDESTLAALIEGELGAAEADGVRERLLDADPAWAARIELMERDRVMLRALGDETPPGGLAESVVARLEREALLGLASGEPASGRPPVSIVQPARPTKHNGIARWIGSPAGAGLAMAALLVLGVGVGLQVIGPRPTQPQPFTPDLAEEAGAVPPIALSEGASRKRPSVLGDPAMPPPVESDAAPPALLTLAQPAPDRIFTDPERALALLAEDRLIVRVRSGAPDEAAAELARIAARQARPNEAFRLAPGVSEPVALAMAAHFAPAPIEDAPTALAAEDGEPITVEPREIEQPVTALESVYLADARMDKAALASLLAALSLGDGKAAVFEELPEPLALPQVLTPDAVLWWSHAPSEWSRRAYVPIAVERVER